MSQDTLDLDQRARNLLRTLISQYIRDGRPVGSRTLARMHGVNLSPATIRNVMADLESEGLVAAPHTSAGRVPTPRGYRLFVDSMLHMPPLAEDQLGRIQAELSTHDSGDGLIESASNLLSGITHFVGLVTVPKRDQLALRHIDFVSLESNKVLVILVLSDNEVQNRVIQPSRPYSRRELEKTANYINQHYSGQTLHQIVRDLVRQLRSVQDSMDAIMQTAADMAERTLQEPDPANFVVAGQTNLMSCVDLANLDRLRELFEAFSRKQEIISLLEGCIHADGVRLFIGDESGSEVLGECSVVTAPYSVDGQVLGVLGVVGPTRMKYDHVIQVVETTGKLLGQAMRQLS
ncbi:MAG: heat-inducible transcription repressor HrcA [Lysobacteraceae bacterium]|nr:MAG: heat-inducible transcription repressor HrcA [Xanthomonadaceae bacterium]